MPIFPAPPPTLMPAVMLLSMIFGSSLVCGNNVLRALSLPRLAMPRGVILRGRCCGGVTPGPGEIHGTAGRESVEYRLIVSEICHALTD
jgi:hypothetical protein